MKKIIISFSFLLIGICIIDCIRIFNYKVYPKNPDGQITTYEDEIYHSLLNNKTVEWSKLLPTLTFINNEYDVSDFKLVNLIRILYRFPNQIPQPVKQQINKCLLNFRYWMDEPGGNSMCYWSENHQILFSSAELLIGQIYKDSIFRNSKLTGEQHMQKSRQRVLDWLEMRWQYGFTEFYSGTYYKEDIAALINLIDFAEDEEIRSKATIILDLLFYDVAAQSVNASFSSVSGRAYEPNRKGGPHETLDGVTYYLQGFKDSVRQGLVYSLTDTRYVLPGVFEAIISDTTGATISQTNGLNITQLREKGFVGTDEKSIMMQWGMEAFTNPEVIRNSMQYIRKNRMFSNAFLSRLKYLDFTLIKWLHLEPLIMRWAKLQEDGKAIQQANTYTYRNKNYALQSVQNYFPGTYADQQHINSLNVAGAFSVFHNNPAEYQASAAHSPNYWVGYGVLPNVAQYNNISMSVYDLKSLGGLGSGKIFPYTHAYFPASKFDTVLLKKNYAFGKKQNVYCALIGYHPLSWVKNTTDDLLQPGEVQFWILQGGGQEEYHSFENFCSQILRNNITFDVNTKSLTYSHDSIKMLLGFTGSLTVNGKEQKIAHARFNSPYISGNIRTGITIACKQKMLFLDFYKMERTKS